MVVSGRNIGVQCADVLVVNMRIQYGRIVFVCAVISGGACTGLFAFRFVVCFLAWGTGAGGNCSSPLNDRCPECSHQHATHNKC